MRPDGFQNKTAVLAGTTITILGAATTFRCGPLDIYLLPIVPARRSRGLRKIRHPPTPGRIARLWTLADETAAFDSQCGRAMRRRMELGPTHAPSIARDGLESTFVRVRSQIGDSQSAYIVIFGRAGSISTRLAAEQFPDVNTRYALERCRSSSETMFHLGTPTSGHVGSARAMVRRAIVEAFAVIARRPHLRSS